MNNPFTKDAAKVQQKAYWSAKKEAEELFGIVSRMNKDVIVCTVGYNKVVVSTEEDSKDAAKLLGRLKELRNTYIESKVHRNNG